MCLHHDCLYYRYRDTAKRVFKKRKATSANKYLLRTDNVLPDTHRRQHDRYEANCATDENDGTADAIAAFFKPPDHELVSA